MVIFPENAARFWARYVGRSIKADLALGTTTGTVG